ncbi:hypothetical protein EB796_003033 [Bugula neritina]|uniref:Uncharacterized protein n=1 Tax=Bugula neritina TaxID=10212 RepID=A0A7J7KJ88_BUGNE|nr:hypothetical protein EB796_003033 [Bugula neritina]
MVYTMHFSLYRYTLKVITITTLNDFQYKPILRRYRNRVTTNELKGSGSIDTRIINNEVDLDKKILL